MRLRNFKKKDVQGMLEWMKDDSINMFFAFDAKRIDEASCLTFINEAQSEIDKHYAIVDDNDAYMGTVSLKNIDKKNSHAEYAVALRKTAHGKGIAKIATDEILRIAFEDLGLDKVYLNVYAENKRAIAFYEKYGFTYEGEFIRHIRINGELCNLKWYAFFKDQFL